MSQKITLPGLVAELALRTGDSKQEAEEFVKTLFSVIADNLEAGESVKVHGLGVFKVIEVEARKSVNVSSGEELVIPAHRKVTFVPVKELAASVNAPFEMFQTVVLPDEIADKIESEVSAEESLENAPEETIEPHPSIYKIDETEEEMPEINQDESEYIEKSEESEDCEYSEDNEVTEESGENEHTEHTELIEENDVEEEEEEKIVQEEKRADEEKIAENEDSNEDSSEPVVIKKSRFWPGFWTGLLVSAACLFACWWAYTCIFADKKIVKDVASSESTALGSDTVVVRNTTALDAASEDSVKDSEPIEKVAQDKNETVQPEMAPTAPSDQRVYDTITKTRYLTTMAKDHYGNYHLWPYIYIENEKILGHPNHIRPGTQVVIPDLKKYGVDPNSKSDIEKAKQKGQEIYNRYK